MNLTKSQSGINIISHCNFLFFSSLVALINVLTSLAGKLLTEEDGCDVKHLTLNWLNMNIPPWGSSSMLLSASLPLCDRYH